MSYFSKPYNPKRTIISNNKEEKIQVIYRIPKIGTPPEPNNDIISKMHNTSGCCPYSVSPRPFYEAISYVTYPGVMPYMYLINTRGCIFDADTGMLHKDYNDDGYTGIGLRMTNGLVKKLAVHRLVAYQFCNPPYNFQDMAVNHINGNKHCNFANNLEWITIAENNQHSMIIHTNKDTRVVNGRPSVNETFVKYLCEQFEKGKSNTEITRELGMEINNANHTLLRDIRSGNTWKHVTCNYNFARSSKKHAYTSQEKEQIKTYMTQGKTDKEIFKIMQGREYVASTDRKDSSYRTIQTIRDSSWFKRYNYNLQKI